MPNVLFLGKSDRRIEAWARAHARVVKGDNGHVIFLALYGENYTQDNFTFVNCCTLPQQHPLTELQELVPASINRAIACDRSLTDYTYSTSYGSYSNYRSEQIEQLVGVVGNALLHFMPQIDYCVDGLADNFVTPLAFQIAHRCKVKFYMVRLWHYWDQGFHLVDSPGYVSKVVDDYYRRYYPRLSQSVYPRVREDFERARFSIGAFQRENWQLRLQIVRDKFFSYERPSAWHFLQRRHKRLVGRFGVRGLRFVTPEQRPQQYIVFALHVMPEASILGTDPDIADQFSLIRRMSLNVPLGVKILCKAHPGERFGRDIDIEFLRRICSLHNVSLVHESERIDSFLNDSRCVAVATINGSVALEAVIKEKPCFLFGKGIFAIAECFLKPRDDEQFFEQVMQIVHGRYSIDKVALAAIILSLKRAAIPGSGSLKAPGSWLDFYSSLLPSIHRFHKRSPDGKAWS